MMYSHHSHEYQGVAPCRIFDDPKMVLVSSRGPGMAEQCFLTSMGANPGGGGTGGRVPPPPLTFFQVGDTISNVPPRFGGRMNFGRYNVFFCLFFYSFFGPFFFFFLLVRNVRDVGWVPLHIFTCATFDADGAPEKSVGVPPGSYRKLDFLA